MSLEHLPSPKAAADLIAAFRKRFSTKVCMAPHADHDGPIVSAHTLSKEAVLRIISKDAHVYAPNVRFRFFPDENPIQIRRLGIGDVSVFNGYCAKHDASLFSCLENEPFTFQPKQIFMLAYRATARECYLKRKQYESLPTPEQYGAIHKVKDRLKYTDEALRYQEASLRGAEEIEAFKTKLDGYLLQEDWKHFESFSIHFPKTPSLVASFVFQPFFDMNGNQLQDVTNLRADMSTLAISLLPLEKGGVAIFSWLDTANAAPLRFYASVAESKNRTSAIIHAILDNGENFAISPEWYEDLPSETKDYILSRMRLLPANVNYSFASRPDELSPYLDDWEK
jgi:hypothetical protein